jgi:hypothetical protein
LGALFFVAIFVLGTATTAFVFTQQAPATSTTGTPTGVAGQTTPLATDQLVQQGDTAATAGKYADAISYYRGAIALGATNAPDIQYKLGRAQIQDQLFQDGVTSLQTAVAASPNASWSADANTLIGQNQGKPNAATTPGASPPSTAGTPSGASSTAPAGSATAGSASSASTVAPAGTATAAPK